MKMHPKPMARHTKAVEPVTLNPRVASLLHPEPFHILVQHAEGRTQVLTMTRDECHQLFTSLGTMLRYEGARAADIDPNGWKAFHSTLRSLVDGSTTFGRATGGQADLQQVSRAGLTLYLSGTVNCRTEVEAINAYALHLTLSPFTILRKGRRDDDGYTLYRLKPRRLQPGQVPFELEDSERTAILNRLAESTNEP